MNTSVSSQKHVHRLFWLFTLAVAFLLTWPVLIKDGMFIDGVLYSAVSHNLANGIGTFWFPSFSFNNMAGIHNSFHEQPPLVFGIQSLFFKLLGSSIYVERFYTAFMLLLNIWLIKKLWEKIFQAQHELASLSWFPVLLWITIPICFWSFTHNMHENTVSVFILASVIFLLQAIRSGNQNVIFINLAFSACFVFLASFSKGLPGLFPLAAPFAFAIGRELSWKKAFISTTLMTLIVAGVYVLMMFSEDARRSMYNYVYLRLLKRIQEVPTTSNYLDTLFRLFFESLPMIGLALMLKLGYRNKLQQYTSNFSNSLIYLLIGLFGVMPLMLTLVQKGFYMLPALPFVAVAFAIYMSQEVKVLTEILSRSVPSMKILKWTGMLLFAAAISLTIMNVGSYSRNESLLKDIHAAGRLIPEHSVINCTYDLQRDWSLQTYLSRYYFISLDTNSPHDYYLADKAEYSQQKDSLFSTYRVVSGDFNNFVLLKR
jgi:hypothetical protein